MSTGEHFAYRAHDTYLRDKWTNDASANDRFDDPDAIRIPYDVCQLVWADCFHDFHVCMCVCVCVVSCAKMACELKFRVMICGRQSAMDECVSEVALI